MAFAAIAMGTVAVLAASSASAAPASSQAIDFDGYTLGSPVGQNGWTGVPAGTDYAIVDNASVPGGAALGAGQSLRYSNAVASSAHNQLLSPVVTFVGEPSSGATENTFSGDFTVASATGGIQPGLDLDVAVTYGANRTGGIINLLHTASGLQIGTYWFPVGGTDVNDTAQWRSQILATVDATVAHRIGFSTVFDDNGPDQFTVSVDGAPVATVPTWENYYDVRDGNSDDKVNGLLIRPGNSAPSASGVGYDAAPAQPSLAGAGYLLSDIAYQASNTAPALPTTTPALDPGPSATPAAAIPLPAAEFSPGQAFTVTLDGFAPYEDVYLTWYSSPIFAGWFQADGAGVVTASVTVPASLEAGTHTLQATGTSGRVVSSAFQLVALAATGVDPSAVVATAAGLLVAGLSLGGVALRRRRGQAVARSR